MWSERRPLRFTDLQLHHKCFTKEIRKSPFMNQTTEKSPGNPNMSLVRETVENLLWDTRTPDSPESTKLTHHRSEISSEIWPKDHVYSQTHNIIVINLLAGKPSEPLFSFALNCQIGVERFFRTWSILVKWREPIIVTIALENALRLTWGLTQSKRLKGRLTDDFWP